MTPRPRFKVDAIDIRVKTFRSIVQLSGFADRIAAGVAGVERVPNDIRAKHRD